MNILKISSSELKSELRTITFLKILNFCDKTCEFFRKIWLANWNCSKIMHWTAGGWWSPLAGEFAQFCDIFLQSFHFQGIILISEWGPLPIMTINTYTHLLNFRSTEADFERKSVCWRNPTLIAEPKVRFHPKWSLEISSQKFDANKLISPMVVF